MQVKKPKTVQNQENEGNPHPEPKGNPCRDGHDEKDEALLCRRWRRKEQNRLENAWLTLRPVWQRPLTPRTFPDSRGPLLRARHDGDGARVRARGGARGG